MIRRTELIEVLSKLGLYILEKGKVMDAASGDGSSTDMRQQQQAQVHRLKGRGGAYANNSARAARALVMHSDDTSAGDFSVSVVDPRVLFFFSTSTNSC